MIEAVSTSLTAFVGVAKDGPIDEPTKVGGSAEFDRVFGGLWEKSMMSYAVRDYFLNGGSEALVVRVGHTETQTGVLADLVPLPSSGRGLYALDRADLFNLLCVPPLTRDRDLSATALGAASHYCARRRAFFIVDPPATWKKPADVLAEPSLQRFASLTRENAAVYFPRLRQTDPLRGTVESVPPSGSVAGVIARTDSQRGVWRAPAGQAASLRGLEGLSTTLTDNEAAAMAVLGVNPIRPFPEIGSVLWGARTMAGADPPASDWKYIPVRRLALFLEESLDRGTRWAVFEPNEEPLWARLRAEVGAFLLGLFKSGALQGSTPTQAYFVKCDADTTKPADVDAGVVNVIVGFAPLKPAEFVLIKIRQLAQT